MKLPDESLTRDQKLAEFDVWITPVLIDIRKTKKYESRHDASVRAFDRLCEATADFTGEELTHDRLADSLVGLFSGKSQEAVYLILTDLVGVLFQVTGKAGNSAKCQFPLFITTQLKRLTIPKAKVRTRKGIATRTVEQAGVPRVIEPDTYMKWVSQLQFDPAAQRDLIDIYLRFVLDEDIYLSQLWSVGRSYALLKPLGRAVELLNPLIVFQVRGSVAATGGHVPEHLLRKIMGEWGLESGSDYNPSDVKINDELKIPVAAVVVKTPGGKKPKKVKSRSFDFALPYNVPPWGKRILIQSQYYAGDSGSVSHKTVDQATASRAAATGKLPAGVRFIEYLDGAGFFKSTHTDLRSLLDMPDTAGIIQIRSAPIRLRRELQHIGFLTTLEIEHAILTVGPEIQRVGKALHGEGYSVDEVNRAISVGLNRGQLLCPDKKTLAVSPLRRDMTRRYLLLDAAAKFGKPLTLAESSATGLFLVPGYGPYHGLLSNQLRAKAERLSPALATDWAAEGVFDGDLAWLVDRGYAILNQ